MIQHQLIARCTVAQDLRKKERVMTAIVRAHCPQTAVETAELLMREHPVFNHNYSAAEKLEAVRFCWTMMKRWNKELTERQKLEVRQSALEMDKDQLELHKWVLSQYVDSKGDKRPIQPSQPFGGERKWGAIPSHLQRHIAVSRLG